MEKCNEIRECFMKCTYKHFLTVSNSSPSVEYSEDYIEWLESEYKRLSQAIIDLRKMNY